MDLWCVRYANLCGQHISYDVEAENEVEAWDIAKQKFQAEDPDLVAGYELEGVYKYE